MTEPASSAAGAVAAWKLGLLHKLVALFGIGAVGAALMSLYDPPASRRALFAQALAAGVVALTFTLPALRWLDSAVGWIDLADGDPAQWLEVALPVGFLLGSVSWGGIGALVKLRSLIRDRAAQALASKAGLTE